jgi:hypothetical protein
LNFGFVSSSSSQSTVDGNDGLHGLIQGFVTFDLDASSYVGTLGVSGSTTTQVNLKLGSSSLSRKEPSSTFATTSAYTSTIRVLRFGKPTKKRTK